jgi:uncharacterized protein (TIGR00725 family)
MLIQGELVYLYCTQLVVAQQPAGDVYLGHMHHLLFDPKICVSGAAAGLAATEGEDAAFEMGRQIAVHGCITVTGATLGVPYAAARGAKSVQGQVIGFSPAHSLLEHQRKYRLPVDHHDHVFFTGYDYAGRDTLMVDLSDAVIHVSGRLGTLHEFTSAFERHKVIGVLLGSGHMSDEIPHLLEIAQRGRGRVIMESTPKALMAGVLKELQVHH